MNTGFEPSDTKSPAELMPADKPTELSRMARLYDQRAFRPLDPTASWLSHLALGIYMFFVVTCLFSMCRILWSCHPKNVNSQRVTVVPVRREIIWEKKSETWRFLLSWLRKLYDDTWHILVTEVNQHEPTIKWDNLMPNYPGIHLITVQSSLCASNVDNKHHELLFFCWGGCQWQWEWKKALQNKMVDLFVIIISTIPMKAVKGDFASWRTLTNFNPDMNK